MIILASDHAGYELKQYLKLFLSKNNIEFTDVGALTYDAQDDYPDLAKNGVSLMFQDDNNKGIFICGSGVGMSMVANRYKGIRAVLALDVKTAQMARLHNDANVLCLGQRRISKHKAIKIVLKFLTTKFEGGKHKRRIDKF